MDGLYLPPKPAIISARPKEIVRPGDPRFVAPMLGAGMILNPYLFGGAGYRYYKWNITATQSGYGAIDELELLDGANVNQLPDFTSNTTSGFTITSSTDGGAGFDDWNAADRATSYWVTTAASPPHWMKIDCGSPLTTRKYTITAPSLNGAQVYAPKTFTFEGSNDDSAWTTLDTQTLLANWTSGEKRTFTF